MRDGEPLAVGGSSSTGGDVTLEPVLGVLDLAWVILVIVVSVDVEVDDMVTKVSHISLTLSSAAGERRAHVRGNDAENVAESHFVLVHLVETIALGDSTQIQVSPSVGGDVVARVVGTNDISAKLRSGVNFSFVDVVTGDEEGGLGIVGVKEIQDVGCEVLERAIIIGDGYSARRNALVDAGATIGDGAKFRASDGRSICSTWGLVLRACRSVGVLATGGVAIVVSLAAPCPGLAIVVSRRSGMSYSPRNCSSSQHRS